MVVVQVEPGAAAAGAEGVVEGLAILEVGKVSHAVHDGADFFRAAEGELAGEGGLEIFLREAAGPDFLTNEVHVDAVDAGGLAFGAEALAGDLGSG